MAYDASLGAEEKTGSLFQPDTLVPTQYLETFRGKAHLEPEKSFMLTPTQRRCQSCETNIGLMSYSTVVQRGATP